MKKSNKVSDKKRRLRNGDIITYNYVTAGEAASVGDWLSGRKFGGVLAVSKPRKVVGAKLLGNQLLIAVETEGRSNLINIQDILKDGKDNYFQSFQLPSNDVLRGKSQETIAVRKAAGWV